METVLRKGSGLALFVACVAVFLVPGDTAYADCGSPANAIEAENCLTGNPPSEWDVTGAGDPNLQGFATDISVNRGETVSFKVSTTATAYRIDIYRLGYYGGDGARKIATIPDALTAKTNQPPCLTDATGLVDCGNWSVSASWAVPAGAVSGIYVAKLVGESGGIGASHVVFVVRQDGGTSAVLFQTSDTTWHAYEYPMVRWLERNGYDVSYTTGVDTDRHGSEILNHRLFLSVGHDEHWSKRQRANVEAASDHTPPVHLAFFGGNEILWKTRRTGNGTRNDNFEVPAADGKMRFWRNTPQVANLTAGQVWSAPPGTLGHGWDADLDDGLRPAGLVRLSTTTLFHKRPNGALVFGSGTVQWPWGLDRDRRGEAPGVDMQQATVNLFADMGVQPATLQSGLLPASASVDRTAPVSDITSPASGATVPPSASLTIQGTATDGAPGLVGGIEVSVDGGLTWHPAQGRESWSYVWTPATVGTYEILARAVDDSGNLESPGAGITITVGGPTPRSGPVGLRGGGGHPSPTHAPNGPPTGWYAGDMHAHRSCGGSPESIASMYQRMVNNDLAVMSLLADMGSGEVQDAAQDLPRVTGQDDPISTPGRLLHWDAEWHWDATYTQYPHQALGGHIVALGLTQAQQVWEEYTYPIFQWAHQRSGIAGFAHMQYLNDAIPDSLDCCTPIEYPVEVALGSADFISEDVLGSESAISAYYRLLNTGFRPGFAAGTDYPCAISDVGSPLTYARVASEPLTYRKWIEGIAAGRTVVSRNGNREFVSLTVDGTATPGDQVNLTTGGPVSVTAQWTASESLSGTIELVKNGEVVASQPASVSSGLPATLSTSVSFDRSGWLAARRMAPEGHVVHTAAVFVIVDGAPIRASVADAEFYVQWMDNLLERTSPGGSWAAFFPTRRAEAQARYQAARTLFQQIADESSGSPVLTVTPPLHGRITGTGINCGTGGSDCSEAYAEGTVVSLTATPDTGYSLSAWTGACTGTGACTVTMDADKTVGATFAIQSYTLTVTLPTNGTITGTGINCGAGGSDCTEIYDYGTVVPLTATPSTGYSLSAWTGACSGTGACSVNMTAARTVGATFTVARYALTVTPPTHGTVTGTGVTCGTGGTDCTETYDTGTVVVLTATPDASYNFGGWTGACSGTGTCSVTMTAARTVGATFTIQRYALTVTPPTNGTITGTGINCGTGGSDCAETYDYGTAVPLTATPAAGYGLSAWTGACSGTGACSVTMTAARTVGATFTILRYTLTVTPPTNGTITATGINCGTGGSDCTEAYDYGTVVPLTATPSANYDFGGWTGACSGTGACSVTMTVARTVGATFTLQRYTLTVTTPSHGTISGTGIVCGTAGSDCTETYDYGTVVPLTATPDSGYNFGGWTGACSGTGACSATMTVARTVGATFTIQRYTLTVTAPTNGTITATGITCGAGGTDCTETYDYGTVVPLTATPSANYDFGGWTGACSGTGACTVTMTAARTVGATFTLQQYTLTVTAPANGTITATGITCGTGGTDCTQAYDYGTVVPLTATPNTGYILSAWNGACSGTGACSVTMTAARTVGATFAVGRYTLTVTTPTHGTIAGTGIACGTGGVDCTETYDSGAVVPLTATPDAGYDFGGWTGACTGTGTCFVTMTAARTVGATFTVQRYILTVLAPANGTITGAGIACGTGGGDCTETFDYGTVVPLTPTPATGYHLRTWTGACSGTGPCSVTLDANKTVGGLFALTFQQRKGDPSTYTGPELILNAPTPLESAPPSATEPKLAPPPVPKSAPASAPETKTETRLEPGPKLAPKDPAMLPDLRRVFVAGEVRNPGAYAWFPGMTARQLISAAGGLTPDASEGALLRLSTKPAPEAMSSRGASFESGDEGSAGIAMDDTVREGETLVVRRPRS